VREQKEAGRCSQGTRIASDRAVQRERRSNSSQHCRRASRDHCGDVRTPSCVRIRIRIRLCYFRTRVSKTAELWTKQQLLRMQLFMIGAILCHGSTLHSTLGECMPGAVNGSLLTTRVHEMYACIAFCMYTRGCRACRGRGSGCGGDVKRRSVATRRPLAVDSGYEQNCPESKIAPRSSKPSQWNGCQLHKSLDTRYAFAMR
jgi:hypothetical protein